MAGIFHGEYGASAQLLGGKGLLAATDAAVSLTAAQSVAVVITQTPTAGRTITTATAAQILAALDEYRVGSFFELTIVNLSAAQTITFAGGTGVTVTGLATVAGLTSGTFIGYIASTSAITYYRK
jgi:hypothetical protein